MNRGRVGEERGSKETGRCPLTMLVSLEHIYSKFGTPIQIYPRHGKHQVLFLHVSVSFTETLKRPMKRIPYLHCKID
jgi:hypothetical protein